MLDILSEMEYLAINTDYAGVQQIQDSPPLFWVDQFLSEEECKYLITTADGLLVPAPVVVEGKDREASSTSEVRTNRQCFLPRDDSHLDFLMEKVSMLTNKPRNTCELPQVGRYDHGQFYRPHYDAVDPHDAKGEKHRQSTQDQLYGKNIHDAFVGMQFCANGGNRVCTVLIYLNTVSSGGSTFFPKLGLRSQPKQGSALIFFPAAVNGEVDYQALHTAEDAEDTKWVSQIWIRQNTRTPHVPSVEAL